MKNETFERLYRETKNHLDKKRYLYKKKKETAPHKNVMLSVAFNIAYENYQNIRPKKGMSILKFDQMTDMLLRYFGNKYYKSIDNIKFENTLIDMEQNHQYNEVNDFRKIEYKLYGTIQRFRNYHSHYIHEPGILQFSDLFKSSEDTMLTTVEFEEAKNWFNKRFNDAHIHLLQSLKNRQKVLEEGNTKLDVSKLDQLKSVIRDFDEFSFFESDEITISLDGQLFIACMFLFKRQAKVVIEKWRDVKDLEGYENTKKTLFTYYSLKENLSVNNFSNDLMKFREITSKLTNIPYNENSQLEFIYKKIKEINEINYREIDEEEKKDKSNKSKNNKSANDKLENEMKSKILKRNNPPKKSDKQIELESKIMPIRKRDILTEVLLQYLLDNDLFSNEYKIAIKKSPLDRTNYYQDKEELDEKKNLTYLKNQIKKLEKNDPKRKKLNEHLKELKRNFIFLTPNELKDRLKEVISQNENNEEEVTLPIGYTFSIKKKNALVQFTSEDGSISNITISSQLLMKWVFIHLINGKSYNQLTNYITNYIKSVNKEGVTSEIVVSSFKRNPKYNHLGQNVFPKSLTSNASNTNGVSDERITEFINVRIDKLEKFEIANSLQDKPWKYASKEKIDTILEYMHFRLLHDVHKKNIGGDSEEQKITFIRHNYFNMTTYNYAREYYRFFGRYKNNNLTAEQENVTMKVVRQLRSDYTLCFSYVNPEIEELNSLEALFNSIIKSYIKRLKELNNNRNNYSENELVDILKINRQSNTNHVNELLKDKFYSRSFALHNDVISIEKELKDEWEKFKMKKQKELGDKPFYCSDYSYMRNVLQDDGVKTNIDFILRHIIPETGFKKIPNPVFKKLLTMKTEELVLWKIAKFYWKKKYNNEYKFDANEQDNSSANYQMFCTFNKVYKKELDFPIVIDEQFWNNIPGKPDNTKRFKRIYNLNLDLKNNPIKFTIKVPANRFDNKFLNVETELIKEYCLWNLFNEDEKTVVLDDKFKITNNRDEVSYHNMNNYDEIIKVIYKELRSSVADIGLLLSAEKNMVDSDRDLFYSSLKEKYESNLDIKDFYLGIREGDVASPDTAIFNKFISKLNVNNNNNNDDEVEEYLVSFRNFALHYQLQDPERKKAVKEFLEKISNFSKASKSEYHKEEKTVY